jgi:hypothetical protein
MNSLKVALLLSSDGLSSIFWAGNVPKGFLNKS